MYIFGLAIFTPRGVTDGLPERQEKQGNRVVAFAQPAIPFRSGLLVQVAWICQVRQPSPFLPYMS